MTAPPEDLHATLLTVREGVAWVTLNRPDAANARNQGMRDELTRIYDWVEQEPKVAALVLTGAGDRFFCAGMDLKEAGQPESQLDRRERLRRGRDVERLAALPVPTVAAINGYAVGGGLEMALACDLRIAADSAELGLPEVTHGLMPGAGGTQRLSRLVGHARAVELVLRGQRVTASRAVEIGLVNRAVAADDLPSAAEELASQLAGHPREAVRGAKEALRAALELPLSQGLDRELDGLLFLLQHRAEGERTKGDQ